MEVGAKELHQTCFRKLAGERETGEVGTKDSSQDCCQQEEKL